MSANWQALGMFCVLSGVVPLSLLGVSRLLQVRARKASLLKPRTYECGEDPIGSAWIQFHPRYFIIALFFVLFDVEVAFFFPWALTLRDGGVAALMAAASFAGVLMLGWWYCVAKGILRWH